MEKRSVLFVGLSILIIIGSVALSGWLRPHKPPAPPPQVAKNEQKPPKAEPGKGNEGEKPSQPGEKKPPAEKPEPEKPAVEKPVPEVAEPKLPRRWVTLGSADPDDPYRMLVALTSEGAAVARIEFNSPRYRELEDRSGDLGYIAFDPDARDCTVGVVGPGTPVAKAGLCGATWSKQGDRWVKKAGDVIKAVDGKAVATPGALDALLEKTRPGRTITLTVERGDATVDLPVTLGWRPLAVVRPENDDPLSLLLTLQRIDKEELTPSNPIVEVGEELAGVRLWSKDWELVEADQEHAQFRRELPGSHLEVVKTYRLCRVPEEAIHDTLYKAYHLDVQIEVHNRDQQPHTVAYQLDGPNGLPTEGHWYAYKVSSASGTAGLRDMLIGLGGNAPVEINCPAIAAEKAREKDNEKINYLYQDFAAGGLVDFAGIDAQYFSAILMPQSEGANWFAKVHPLRVGAKNEEDIRLTNVSCRLISAPVELKPGAKFDHTYTLFVGPKRPELLASYGLNGVLYYGWPIFAWVARPLVQLMHGLHAIIPSYGIVIILLTVLVRGCMFPLSRKQALNAQKMQELQPEIKRIQEKYKKDAEARTKAQQELFRKHNYNPLGGCLVLFIQLPIFMGLYRTLMIDVELRQAPLISESIRWCSNLAAPDMLYDWSRFMPEWFNAGSGFIALGPYLNLLPILTVILFNWQQKMMMPPPADEQAAMQQKLMKYMMMFMGLLFYKVASGLCIYFIASSLWGLAERKFLPKSNVAAAAQPQNRADAKAEARAAAAREQTRKKK